MSSDTNAHSSDQQRNNACLHSDDENHPEKVEDDDEEEKEEEDEEEDVDFNPFLKGTPSPDASSSLSSEIEELDGDSSKPVVNEVRNYDVGDSEHGEEVVMLNTHALCTGNGKKLQLHKKSNKRKSDCVSQSENESLRDNAGKDESLDDEDEDAIWKRTRARYSLASFTLDELETFLQETDDEDDLQNVDDEEEYRKFLAAVLQGGDGDGQSAQGYENVDYEDEDNDADFEIELEELLESDVDDRKRNNDQKVENERVGRRPETRQNRRQKASAQYKKKLLEQTKRPLRPLLPIMPNGTIASLPSADGKVLTTEAAPSYLSSTAGHGLINGFTPQQIGQLHCLIHEHVQLLVQVFSLCVLDPSRQQIASQVQGLIFEMLHKRDEVIASRSVPYPCICFHPSYMCPSVMDELPNSIPSQCTESSSAPNMQMPISLDNSATMGRNNHVSNGQINTLQNARSFWMPFVSGPLVSILDVAPLNLVARFMDDVFNAVREYRQRHLDSSCDTWNEREPIFQLPHSPSPSVANVEVSKGNVPHAVSAVPPAAGQQPPKKTLAASIVENVKKQSVALVPKDISKLAQRFNQLFNPALFPHKPPPAAVANRVLFTDSEDELLALGMMLYNTDWKAIQQRFLPCKTKHQIFVRQKNRCSSKAPENPIKVVRRMKTSPLTAEEIECIQEGLRVLKHDWMSVWRFIVPHRDPSLLPRQWRIALGTQRSYKSDAVKKEKRRIYELNRRRCKTADLANWKQDNQVESTGGINNSGDDYVDNSNEAYVHQAFLADWKPDTSNFISSARPFLNLRDQILPAAALPSEGVYTRNQPHIDNMLGFPYAHYYQYPHIMPHFTNSRHGPLNSVQQICQVSDKTLNSAEAPIYLWPYRTRRTPGTHLVKLAPDLPPVNLPPTVRVISQAAFKSSQTGVPMKVSTSVTSTGDARKENSNMQLPNTSLATSKRDKSNQVGDKIADSCSEEILNSHPEESAILHYTSGAEERVTESDLQMHPLLFQPPEDGASYYPLPSSTGASGSFTFFSANHPQLNLSLFHSPHSAKKSVDCFSKSSKTKESAAVSCGIDFHPLLQRAEEESRDLAAASSNGHQYGCLGGKSPQFQNPVGAAHKSPVNVGPSAAGSKPSCPIEKANELDLEIHLSSTSTMEKIRGQRDIGASNQSKSSTTASENTRSKNPCNQYCENCSTVQETLVSGADASAVPSSSDDGCNMDDFGDQSPPEIVMEQEELSDSDEETEEHVQFECEEMADSDGDEGLGCDPIAEVHDKEFPNYATEEATTDSDYGDKQCEWSSVHPSGNTPISMKGSPLLKLNLTSLGKDATNGSWLTLDSCAPVDPPVTKAKHEECVISVCPVSKNLVSGRPNRSCKKTVASAKSGAREEDVVDMAQQLSLGLLAVSTLKKPRKRASRINKGLSTGRTNGTSGFDQDKVG